MNFIQVVDTFVLKHITKFSHWFQRLTGKTCYFLAKVMFSMVVADAVINACNYWIRVIYHESSISDIIIAPILVFIWGNFIYNMDESDRHLFAGERTKVWNNFVNFPSALKVFFFVIGLCSLLTLPRLFFMKDGFWFFNINHNLIIVYISLGIYFASVDPLPPGISKVREWIESFNAGFQKLQPLRPPAK